MNIEIYYFTGTGNSLTVARELAPIINAKLIPIASVIGKKSITTNADAIGIIFPVYYVDLPVIVKNFAGKLENINDKYIFAVCTYGGGAGCSLESLSRIISSGGGELSAMFGVHMPQNAFFKPWENKKKVFECSRRKIEIIGRKINQKKKGKLLIDKIARFLLLPVEKPAKKLFRNYLEKTCHSAELSNDELIHMLDKNFQVNERCTGCGTCSKVCPVNNIKIKEKKPVWLNHCENCLACCHWCPEKAILGGISPPKNYRYRHPDIKISDIIDQKK